MRSFTQTLRRSRAFTLVELLVGVALIGIISLIIMGSLVQGYQVTQRAQDRVTAFNELQRATERMGRELRAADPLILASDGDNYDKRITADVYRDSGKVRYTYELVADGYGGNELVVTEETYLTADDTTPDSTRQRILVSELVEPHPPLLRYFDRTGVEATDPSDSTAYASASRIEITLERDLPKQSEMVVTTSATVRNTLNSNTTP